MQHNDVLLQLDCVFSRLPKAIARSVMQPGLNSLVSSAIYDELLVGVREFNIDSFKPLFLLFSISVAVLFLTQTKLKIKALIVKNSV